MPRLSALLLLLAAHAAAQAGEFVPGGNAGTLARTFALPALGETTVLKPGYAETRMTADFANEYVQEGACAIECITLDGETARVRLLHRRALSRGWDLALEVPWLDTGGGFLDGWIEDWHDWFGLPNGGRELAAQGQYLIRYERAGTVLLEERRRYSGLGDMLLTVGRRVGKRSALRAMAKLPTGDEERLAGGTAGGALWLDHGFDLKGGWDGYLSLGVSANERGGALRGMQRTEVAFGGIGVLAPLTESVRLSLQLQAHGRLYDGSELSPLQRAGMPLTLGLQFGDNRGGTVELGFQEDPSVNGSPDFVAYLSFRS